VNRSYRTPGFDSGSRIAEGIPIRNRNEVFPVNLTAIDWLLIAIYFVFVLGIGVA